MCLVRRISENDMILTDTWFAVLLGLILLFLVINALYTGRAAYYLRKIEQAMREDR